MTRTEVMKELKANGSAQTRKTYRRHGLTGDMFGVSYAVLGKMKRKIKATTEDAFRHRAQEVLFDGWEKIRFCENQTCQKPFIPNYSHQRYHTPYCTQKLRVKEYLARRKK